MRYGGRVSTHSRPKAAGAAIVIADTAKTLRFNTQPPEGGWTWAMS